VSIGGLKASLLLDSVPSRGLAGAMASVAPAKHLPVLHAKTLDRSEIAFGVER
jgi:hypothetical protein